MKHEYLRISRDAIETERAQCRDEGREMHVVEQWFDQVLSTDLAKRGNWLAAQNLMDQTIGLPIESDFKFTEPSVLAQIKEARPWGEPPVLEPVNRADIAHIGDQVYGAWAGRCAGCLLGLPFKGMRRQDIAGLLRDTDHYPLDDYLRAETLAKTPEVVARYQFGDVARKGILADQIGAGGMVEDDSLNYTVMNLALFRKCGMSVTPTDICEFWLENIPIMHAEAAECVAYRNVALQIMPPESATYRNPYREWHGAMTRGDYWGYVAPGEPEKAAELAWRDASMSHVKNGIYAALWVAAMTAAAFATTDIRTVVECGVAQIPEESRLALALKKLLATHAEGTTDYDAVIAQIHSEYDERIPHQSYHAIPNALVVATALLWGENDFEKTVCRAVQPGLAADANGATAGSIMGLLTGRKALPEKWTDPLRDTLRSGVENLPSIALKHLAQATLQAQETVLGKPGA